MAASAWSNINTCFEIGIELYKLMEEKGVTNDKYNETSVDRITEGVLLVSNNEEIMIAVKKDTASQELSGTAVSSLYCNEKDGYLIYSSAAAAIPLFELSKTNPVVRDYIVSDRSLRATLCGNYPEYVKTHNMSASPDGLLHDTDAPPNLFLQKQLDNAADSTRIEVAEFQHKLANEADRGRGIFDDVLELER